MSRPKIFTVVELHFYILKHLSQTGDCKSSRKESAVITRIRLGWGVTKATLKYRMHWNAAAIKSAPRHKGEEFRRRRAAAGRKVVQRGCGITRSLFVAGSAQIFPVNRKQWPLFHLCETRGRGHDAQRSHSSGINIHTQPPHLWQHHLYKAAWDFALAMPQVYKRTHAGCRSKKNTQHSRSSGVRRVEKIRKSPATHR